MVFRTHTVNFACKFKENLGFHQILHPLFTFFTQKILLSKVGSNDIAHALVL